jgi:hypothetical protein
MQRLTPPAHRLVLGSLIVAHGRQFGAGVFFERIISKPFVLGHFHWSTLDADKGVRYWLRCRLVTLHPNDVEEK